MEDRFRLGNDSHRGGLASEPVGVHFQLGNNCFVDYPYPWFLFHWETDFQG